MPQKAVTKNTWIERYDEMIEKFNGKTVLVTKENGLVKQFISSELELAKQEERERIEKNLIHNGWHETGCPAHCNNMRKEEDCDCLYGFVMESLHQNNNEQGGK